MFPNINEIEDSLKDRFQEHLSGYYEREAQLKEDFLNHIYGPEEETEEES